MSNNWGAGGLWSELLLHPRSSCKAKAPSGSAESTNQQEAILEGFWEEECFEEDLEGEELLFGTREDGTALDLKSACYKDTECYGKNKSKRCVIFIIIKVWVDQRRRAWERGWHKASTGVEEQRCKGAKALVVRKVGAVTEDHFDFVMDAEKGISRC